jgi:hypothetical protein
LAGDTRVVTRNGIKRLDTVLESDRVWDGAEWVAHNGLVAKGEQPVINLWGVHLTPDHKVLMNAGWMEAKDCYGLDRCGLIHPPVVGHAQESEPVRSSAEVYDLMDCGPRNRFAVLDECGRPFIVHNCTQGLAASLLRQTLVKIHTTVNSADIVGHTHDEVICETDEDNAELFAERLKSIMLEGFDWTTGLPLGAEVKTSWFYHK